MSAEGPRVASRPSAPDFDFGPRDAARVADVRCARCGTSNPVDSRFCAECGGPLAPAAGAADAAPAAPVAPAPAAAPKPALAAAPVVHLAAPVAVESQSVVCPRCRGRNLGHMSFCQYCGARISDREPPATSPESPTSHKRPEGRPTGQMASPPIGAAPVAPPRPGSVPPPPRSQPPPQPPPPPLRAPEVGAARLIVVAQDGSPGRDYPLGSTQTDIGRTEGDIRLPNDPYVSPRHARIIRKEGRFFARDLGSTNGVFVRLKSPSKLRHGDWVLVGLEVLRFEVVNDTEKGLGPATDGDTQVFGSPMLPRYARLCQRTVEGVTRDVYYVSKDEIIIGREAGDIVFTTDPFMSRRHASISRERDGGFTLRDLGSSNGTYLAIREDMPLSDGDHVRVGQHLFRLDQGRGQG